MEDNLKFSSLEVGATDHLLAVEEVETTEEVEEATEIEMTEAQEETMAIGHKEDSLVVTDQEDVSIAEKKDI
jgi:hypothetical protein